MTSRLEHLPKERWSSPFRKASFTTANRRSRGPSFYRRALASANAVRGCLSLCNFHLIPKYWYKLSPKNLLWLESFSCPEPKGKKNKRESVERICSCRRCFVVLVWLGKRSDSSDFDRSYFHQSRLGMTPIVTSFSVYAQGFQTFQKNPTRKRSLKQKKGPQPIRNKKQLTMGIRVEQIDSS